MPFGHYGLDNFVGQGLSKLEQCDAPDLSADVEGAGALVKNFILSSMLRVRSRDDARPYIIWILRRSHMAFLEYEAGRAALIDYLQGPSERIAAYFEALYRFEQVLSLLWQCFQTSMQFADKILNSPGRVFEKGDGSAQERLNGIYNAMRHSHDATPAGFLHVLWITNSGVSVASHSLDWSEIADLVRDVSKGAEMISTATPKS